MHRTAKRQAHTDEPPAAPEPTRKQLAAMTDQELCTLSLERGRLGMRAWLVWSERSLAKRDNQNFSLK